MISKTILAALVVTALGAAPAAKAADKKEKGKAAESTSASTGQIAAADQKFVNEAAIGGLAEVQLGKLAHKKGTSEQVKQFGQQMVTDHSKANDELKAVSKSKGIALPKDLDAEHKATADRLSKLEGDAFDKAYSAEMLKDHKKDVSEFEKASKNLQDPDLKGFATKTLPVLKQHLQHAQGLAGAEGAGKKK